MSTQLGSVNWGSLPAVPVTFSYDYQRSGTAMQYKVYITISPIPGTGYFGYPIYADIAVEGTQVAGGVSVKAAQPSTWTNAIVVSTGWVTVSGKTSGTTSLAVRLYSGSGSTRDETYRYSMTVTPYSGGGGGEGGSTVTMDDFSLHFGVLTVGEAALLTFQRPGASYQLKLSYALGSASGEVAERDLIAQTTASDRVVYTWTPPASLLSQMPGEVRKDGTVTMKVYRYGSLFGQRTLTASFAVGETVWPSATLTVSLHNDNAKLAGWGLCAKGLSDVTYAISAQPGQGAQAGGCSFTFGTAMATGTAGTVRADTAGTFAPAATVTDSRGRAVNVQANAITVYDYHLPAIRSAFAWRSDGEGNEAENGTCLWVQMQGECAALDGRNTLTLRARFRPKGGQWGSYMTLTAGTAAQIGGGLSPTSVYEVELSAVDALGLSKTITVTTAGAQVTLHLRQGGQGAAFGKYATADGLHCAWDAAFDGDVAVEGDLSAGGLTVGGQTLCDWVYPVGSLYLSTAPTNPAALFGGVWQAIQDRFLLAAGTTYSGGSTGGQASHLLTEAELPSHSHGFSGTTGTQSRYHTHGFTAVQRNSALTTLGSGNYGYESANSTTDTENQSHTHAFSGTTASVGGGTEIDIMPPYLAVFVWKRIS